MTATLPASLVAAEHRRRLHVRASGKPRLTFSRGNWTCTGLDPLLAYSARTPAGAFYGWQMMRGACRGQD